MSAGHPDPADRAVDDGLAVVYAALAADLATLLNLDAGADEAAHPATYTALTNDLADELDFDAGLAAVVGPASAPTHHGLTPTTPLAHHLGDHLRSLSPPQRLALRSRPYYSALRYAVKLGLNICSARSTASATTHALDSARALDRDLDLARARALDLARDVARALARDLDLDRARALDLARDLDRALARDVARALDRDLDRALDRALDLARALDRALDLDRALARARDRALDLDLARALARDLDRDLDRGLDRGLDLARILAVDLDLDAYLDFAARGDGQHDVQSTRRMLTEWDALLMEAGDDFIGADLRPAEHVPPGELTGVRWSLTTRWPSSWEDRVRGASVEIAPGIFEIREGEWRHSLTEVGT